MAQAVPGTTINPDDKTIPIRTLAELMVMNLLLSKLVGGTDDLHALRLDALRDLSSLNSLVTAGD